MAKKEAVVKKVGNKEVVPPEWRDPPPVKAGGVGFWAQTLRPLLQHPGRWAMIKRCSTPKQAQETRNNLQGRKVNIPYPNDDWSFVARDHEVFAVYRGKQKPKRINARVR